MMVKHLFINGVSVLTAKKDSKGNFEYYVASKNDFAMVKVEDYQQFIEVMKKYAHTCLISWDDNLIKQYKELYNFINEF